VEGIGAGLGDPVEIHLHPDQRGVRLLQKKVIGDDPFERDELEIMAMKAELNARLLRLLARPVERLDVPLGFEASRSRASQRR
jgi:hypothetical protein